jgi:hypothetical protein
MAVIEGGSTAQLLEVDANKNAYVRGANPPDFPSSVGGGFSVAGYSVAVVAAALAANTMLASMRFALASSRAAYITNLLLTITPATLGAAAGVAGQLVLQRFTAQTPTGGTARTPARKLADTGGGTDMFDVRDSNAALTGTAPTFGDVIAATNVPLFVANAGGFVWDLDLAALGGVPIRLAAGDGLALRTGSINQAATQTWMYAYTYQYYETAI